MSRVAWFTALVLAALATPAHPVSKAKACKQGCGALIGFCTANAKARGFGDLAGGCKKAVLKRCKQEGPTACAAFCGDGKVEAGEQCDGADLAGATCRSRGVGSGSLACAPDCTFDARGCQPCGNGRRDPGEECDGSDVGGATCASSGFTSGTLACTADCRLDTTGCRETTSVQLPIGIYSNNVFWDDFDSNAGGFFVGDAETAIPDMICGYDGFWTLMVQGAFYNPGQTAELTRQSFGKTLTGAPVMLSGVTVVQQYTTFDDSDTLRVLMSFTNASGGDIPLALAVAGNLGSDITTAIGSTSSGDASFDQSDRWLVTFDTTMMPALGELAKLSNAFVFFGAGSPLATPVSASLVVDNVSVTFQVTVPANSTRRLLFFSQVATDPTTSASRVADFDANATVQAGGFLRGLGSTEMAEIVNWAF